MGLNEFGPIANIERAYLDRTRIKVRVGLLKLYLPGFLLYDIINTFNVGPWCVFGINISGP